MIQTPEEFAPAMTKFGASLASLLRRLNGGFPAEVVVETTDKFNLMYETLYEISNTGSDWNGNAAKARETLEKVNLG